MIYARPNTTGAKIEFKAAHDNVISGKFVPPVERQYFEVITPITCAADRANALLKKIVDRRAE